MKIQDILFWIVFIIGIIVLIWYFIGNSPQLEQVLLILILGIVIKNSITIQKLSSNVSNIEKGFGALAKDFKEHIKHR